MTHVRTLLLALSACAAAATLTACATPAGSAGSSSAAVGAADLCHVAKWTSRDLYGTWHVDFPKLHRSGTLLLRQHPEYRGSLRGDLNYGGQTAIASGDIQQGELDLDESRDGKTLFAMWTGNLVPSTCGKEIRGTWQRVARPGEPEIQTPFILQREGARRAAKTGATAVGTVGALDHRDPGW